MKKYTKNQFNKNMTTLIERKRTNVRRVAGSTRNCRTTIRDWTTGKVKHPLADKRLLRVANFFNVTVSKLVFGEV